MQNYPRPKILIVDDVPINRMLLIHVLEIQYDTLTAEDGEKGLEAAIAEQPDLIILDIHMPNMDGFELLERLKADTLTRKIPVIFLTADTETEAKIKGLKLGAVDFITKPFNAEEVLARVHNHIQLDLTAKLLRQANVRLRQQKALLGSGLQAASEIQKALLPNQVIYIPNMRLSWYFQPCERVGGDIFNVIQLDDSHICIYIIDVCGHGIPAAMIASLTFQYLAPSGGNIRFKDIHGNYQLRSPASVVKDLDSEFPFERFNRYFTMAYAVINFTTGDFSYCCAGHPPLVLLDKAGTVALHGKGGTFVGLGDMGPTVEQGTGTLSSGDRLYFYTDGLIEQESPDEIPFGQERFIAAVQSLRAYSLEKSVEKVIEKIKRYGNGKAYIDDFSLLSLEITL